VPAAENITIEATAELIKELSFDMLIVIEIEPEL